MAIATDVRNADVITPNDKDVRLAGPMLEFPQAESKKNSKHTIRFMVLLPAYIDLLSDLVIGPNRTLAHSTEFQF